MMEILFAYLAGLLTLINPCIIPMLPIVLASAARGNKSGPIALALGLGISFVVVGVLVSTIGRSVGLTEDRLAQVGAILMIGFGLVLLVPHLERRFSLAAAGFANSADMRTARRDSGGIANNLIGGVLLGAIWSPCIGPTLGGAIALASQSQNLVQVTLIMISFAFGVGTIILLLAYGSREAIGARQAGFRNFAAKTKPLLGLSFVLVGLTIFFKFHIIIEGWLVRIMPYWLQDLSVVF